jgi:hypothetical protein
MPMDPNLREPGHGQINPRFGLRDHHRLAREAFEPMTLAATLALDLMRRGMALYQGVLRDN